jgi:hypothetical protein
MFDHPLAEISLRKSVLTLCLYWNRQHCASLPPCARKRDLRKVCRPKKMSTRRFKTLDCVAQLRRGMNVWLCVHGDSCRTMMDGAEIAPVDVIGHAENQQLMMWWYPELAVGWVVLR